SAWRINARAAPSIAVPIGKPRRESFRPRPADARNAIPSQADAPTPELSWAALAITAAAPTRHFRNIRRQSRAHNRLKRQLLCSGMCLNFYDLIATRYRQEKSRRKLAGLVCSSYLYGCPAWGGDRAEQPLKAYHPGT